MGNGDMIRRDADEGAWKSAEHCAVQEETDKDIPYVL